MKSWALLVTATLLAATTLGWMSWALVQADRSALVAENSRLALWRMDLALSRLTAAESTRDADDYRVGSQALRNGPPEDIVLHFDVAPDRTVSTPELALTQKLYQLEPQLENLSNRGPIAAASAVTRNGQEFNMRNVFAQQNAAPLPQADPESAMAPAWLGDDLVMFRRVRLSDGTHVQGAWLDWPKLRASLLREVSDLLPESRLEPVKGAARGDAMMLASIPARLTPGAVRTVVDPDRAQVWWVIVGAWAALVAVAGALATLLSGVLALDERRSAFVSAVTHELRTPLTTFKLYAEMLEADMVPPESRATYLRTLREEANRLGALVENVLAYAQIEKGRPAKTLERLPLSAALEPIYPRLAARAAAAQMTLELRVGPPLMVSLDRVSLEQILFNLVDNACKYAMKAVDRRIILDARTAGSSIELVVTDFGPGVSAQGVRKLFQPFRKSAAEAANAAQGIGLGLALSRRLARAMGGDLEYEPAPSGGATFRLSLRRSA